jgi:hypothetical protein
MSVNVDLQLLGATDRPWLGSYPELVDHYRMLIPGWLLLFCVSKLGCRDVHFFPS